MKKVHFFLLFLLMAGTVWAESLEKRYEMNGQRFEAAMERLKSCAGNCSDADYYHAASLLYIEKIHIESFYHTYKYRDAPPHRLLRGYSFFNNGQYDLSVAYASSLTGHHVDFYRRHARSLYLLGMVRNEEISAFASALESFEGYPHREEMETLLREYAESPVMKPLTAAVLSLAIPGAGEAATGSPKGALYTFLSVAVMTGLTTAAWNSGYRSAAYGGAAFTLLLYGSGSVAAWRSAQRRGEKRLHDLTESLEGVVERYDPLKAPLAEQRR